MANPVKWGVMQAVQKAAMVPGRLRNDSIVAVLMTNPQKRDPFDLYEQARARGPLFKGALKMYATTSHAVCNEVLRSPKMGNPDEAYQVKDGDPVHPLDKPSMIALNPPEHGRQRKLLTRQFTPRAMNALRPGIEQIADDLLDEMAAKDHSDVVTDFAAALPVLVIAQLLGVPTERMRWFRERGYAVAQSLDAFMSYRQTRDSERCLVELNDYFQTEITRRRSAPSDDVLSALLVADADGDSLTDREALATALLLLVAGFETTVNLIGNGTALALEHPETKEHLTGNTLNFVDEVLRFDSPVQFNSRRVLEPLEIAGVPLKAGTDVATLLAAANRDPEVFDRPDVFDPTRANAREHLAFAGGPHFCLGAGLARLEAEIALPKLFERFPDLALTGRPVRRRSPLLRGYDSLPAALTKSPSKSFSV